MVEVVKITPLDLIDPYQHALIWDILEEISLFNDYDDEKLTVRSKDEFLALYLDGRELTVGEDFHVLERVKIMNRETGYYMFKE